MNDIKKTPLEHALDLIQAQKAWIMAVPDDTPLPTMPGFDREEADQLEAFLAVQVAFEKSLNTLPEHDALIKAITMCPHTIDDKRVTLEWSGNSPGNNTLNQLCERLREWKKQFSGPSFIDLRDMPDDQKHALMQNIKAKPAATMKMLHTYGDPPPVLVPDATPPKAPVVDCHATGVCVQSGLRAEKPADPVQPLANIPGLGADESAFIRWALKNKYDTSCHPMFFVMLDSKTHAARMGWKAAVAHYELAAPSAQPAVPLTEPQRKAIYDAVQGLDVMKAILMTEAANSGTKGNS